MRAREGLCLDHRCSQQDDGDESASKEGDSDVDVGIEHQSGDSDQREVGDGLADQREAF